MAITQKLLNHCLAMKIQNYEIDNNINDKRFVSVHSLMFFFSSFGSPFYAHAKLFSELKKNENGIDDQNQSACKRHFHI